MSNILIVDDTKNIRILLKKCLELMGYKVSVALNGQEALDLLLNNKYYLAFLDIKLPEIRGTEVLRKIREIGIKTPIIIITAYATVKNAIDCTNLGAVAYLQKPFSAEKIKSVINEIKPKLDNENFDDRKINKDFSKTSEHIGDSNYYFLLAEKFIADRKYDYAMECINKVLIMDHLNAKVYYMLSIVYNKLGDIKNSEKFFKIYEILKDQE